MISGKKPSCCVVFPVWLALPLITTIQGVSPLHSQAVFLLETQNMKGQLLAQQGVTNSDTPTMSSREIAALTGKEHKNVLRTIRDLITAQILAAHIEPLKFEYRGQQFDYYELGKRDSLVLVARLSPEFTAAIVDRWQELEQKQQPAPMTDAERLLVTAQALVSLERGQQQLEKRIEQIESGSIPAGWQTVSNLALRSGLSQDKTRLFIKVFSITSKKVSFLAPNGILSQALVAEEQSFDAALAELKRTASRPLRGVMWQHPKMGKFQMREVQA